MKSNKYVILFLLFLIFEGLSSCSDEIDIKIDDKESLSIYATLNNINGTTTTRCIKDTKDNWSVASFNTGDVVGIYSDKGNMDINNGEGGFTNAPMYFSRAVSSTFQFDNTELNMDRSKFTYNHTTLYYPYSEMMTGTGINLRGEKTDVETSKCLDFLFMGNLNETKLDKENQLSGNFNHLFSELIIVRGEGFENAENEDITVVMKDAYSHLQLEDNTTSQNARYWKIPQLSYNPECGMSVEECRSWKAWQGLPVLLSEVGSDYKDAWYVILPTLLNPQRSTVSYIEIYDNTGEKQQISSLSLYNGTKTIESGWRYVVEIKMEGLVPTVNPCQIIPWSEEIDITDERTVGINNENVFEQWVRDYNSYKQGVSVDLSPYGDLIDDETTKKQTWHFYILDDFDLSGKTKLRINVFTDILDGLDHTLLNITSDNSFFGSLSGEAQLMNLTIEGLTVNNSSEKESIGGLAGTIGDKVQILNCSIDAQVIADCKVGLLGGTINGCSIENSEFTGLLIGNGSSQDSFKYLSATLPSNLTIKNSNYSGIIFTTK